MSEYLIWWTDQAECEAILDTTAATAFPAYLYSEFQSRLGRNGRGRLWTPSHIPVEGIEWDENKPAGRLAEKRAGIVIEAKDKAVVFSLPGFLTDLELNFINQ